MIDRVVIFGDVNLSTSVLAHMASESISITLLSGRNGSYKARVWGDAHNDAKIRLLQYALVSDKDSAAALARTSILAKLQSQIHIMEQWTENKRGDKVKLVRCLRELRSIQASFPLHPDHASLLGLEGAAARSWFSGFTAMFGESLHFTSRNRRPPKDPVNACLSLGYTLLHAEAVRISYAAGLDPFLGYYHQPDYGRESLACDLIEPLRPVLDQWVWELFHHQTLRTEHFSTSDHACLLGKAGRSHFYKAYEEWAKPVRRLLRMHCRQWIRHMKEGG